MKEKGWDEKVIRTSRWNYFLYYLMVFIVLLVVAYIKINDLRLERMALLGSIVFCLLVIKFTEVHRFSHYYRITSHGLEKVEGVFFKKHKKINYNSINHLHLSQSPIHKLLGIGTIDIAQSSDTIRTEIKNINKPEDFILEVSKRIHSIQIN